MRVYFKADIIFLYNIGLSFMCDLNTNKYLMPSISNLSSFYFGKRFQKFQK